MRIKLFSIFSLLIVGFFLFLALGSSDSKSDEKSKTIKDCSNQKYAYSSGYSSGRLCKLMGDYSSCESFVEKYNYETGRNILSASDCYCEGFNDGKDGNPEKYNSDSTITNANNNDDYSSSNDDATSESSDSTYKNNINEENYQNNSKNYDVSDNSDIDEEVIPFGLVEEVPVFLGCEGVAKNKRLDCFMEQMSKHIRKNQLYPEKAMEKNVQGRVNVLFDINIDGNVTNVQVKGPKGGELLENEARRVIEILPKFKPGIHNGNPVNVRYSQPITFKLQ